MNSLKNYVLTLRFQAGVSCIRGIPGDTQVGESCLHIFRPTTASSNPPRVAIHPRNMEKISRNISAIFLVRALRNEIRNKGRNILVSSRKQPPAQYFWTMFPPHTHTLRFFHLCDFSLSYVKSCARCCALISKFWAASPPPIPSSTSKAKYFVCWSWCFFSLCLQDVQIHVLPTLRVSSP